MSDNGTDSHEDTPLVHVIDDASGNCASFERSCMGLGIQTRSYPEPRAFLEQYDPAQPGCLAVNLATPGNAGLALLAEVARRGWDLPVLILGVNGGAASAVSVTLGRTQNQDDTASAGTEIGRTLDRALTFDRQRRQKQARRVEIDGRVQRLTPRERQVMELVVQGKPNRVIADELGVSPKTVEVHRANVMQKMQADSLANLVKMAIVYQETNGAAEVALSNSRSA